MPETVSKRSCSSPDIAEYYWQTGATEKTTQQSGTEKAKILLVEDNKLIQKVNSGILEKAGFVVVIAANYDEALDLYKQNTYALILLDLGLPGGKSGIDLCRDIRRMEFQNKIHTAILALTAYGESAAKDSYAAGADGFAVKPLLHDGLLEFVSPWVNTNYLRRSY